MEIKPKYITQNYTIGRFGYVPEAIVIHVMEGTLAGCDSWFQNNPNNVSSHFGIGGASKREIHKYVSVENTAHHAGIGRWANGTWDFLGKPWLYVNCYTIGVELEGKFGATIDPATIDEAATLVAWLCVTYPTIKVDRKHIIGHSEVNMLTRSQCPGINMDAFVDLVKSKYPAVYNDLHPQPTPEPIPVPPPITHSPVFIVDLSVGKEQEVVYTGLDEKTAIETFESEIRPGTVELSRDLQIVMSKDNPLPEPEVPEVIEPPVQTKPKTNIITELIKFIFYILGKKA